MFSCRQPSQQFTEISATEAGITFRNDIIETQQTNIMTYEYTYNGAGVAAGDVNNDGLADLYFSGNSAPNKLFLNKGEWKFEDVTDVSATVGRKDWKTGVTMADVNGDGWLDIYVCYSGNAPGEGYNLPVVKEYPNRANQLFINKGCAPGGVPEFVESAKACGLDAVGTFSTQSYFFDYDLDGDLDMLLVNHANMFYAAFFNTRKLRNLRHPYFGNKLYRNDTPADSLSNSKKTPTFTDVSNTSGLHGSGLNFGLSASISDINLDGWPDIYVTNDYEEQDFCYINNKDGTFVEVSHKIFAHLSKFGMGSDIADINNDGLQDVLVLDMLPEDNKRQKLLKGPDEYDRYTIAVDSGYHHQYMRNTLQLNRGFGSDSLPAFSEIGQLAGISNTDWSWSPFLVDLDNDGLKDVFITNGYLRDFTNMDFMKYTSTLYQNAKVANKQVDYLNLIQTLPQTRLANYAFRNKDGIQFENVSQAWGLTRKSVSNGAAYADFDNDGDYDIVTNNLNDTPTLLRNEADNIQRNSFIKIRLKGIAPNSHGIGSRVIIRTDSAEVLHEAFYTRGYASSVEPVLTVGLGKVSQVRNIIVYWPEGSVSERKDVTPNQLITIEQEPHASRSETRSRKNETVLKNISAASGIDFKHSENNFIDFKTHRLLYYQLSRTGGKLAAGDADQDGNDDVFFGGAAGQAGALYMGNVDGTFTKAKTQPWQDHAASEDISALFFDADGDKDPDLYVVSGGSEFVASAPLYQDRLYINDGHGVFSTAVNAIPAETSSGSCVASADYDHDDDLDLFVGSRQIPESYGLIPRSHVFRNDSKGGIVKFTDVTDKVSSSLASAGMVTCAVWTDFNKDSWPDLIVAGEWMPIRVFENVKGTLTEREDLTSLNKTNGWWSCIYAADIDNDGDTDYFLGNAGGNLQFKATEKEPIQLYAGDFNQDGAIDPILCYYIGGTSHPLASRDELLDQIAPLRKKFIKYEDYANATIEDILTPEQLEKAYKFNAYTLSSAWMENLDGKEFKMRPLPPLAQISCINSFLFDDFADDVSNELLLGGNFYPYKPQLGRSDASMGLLLNYSKGYLKVNNEALSNLWLTGDIRDMAILRGKDGKRRLVVSRNDDHPSIFEIVSKH